MSEELYNRKLADLQKHIPFMETMINQLKDPKWKPREAQLNKMESLYNMITDRNKKWKFETLMKCEEVILKLQSKVKANRPIFPNDSRKEQYMNPERPDNVTNTVNDIMNALKFNNARAKLNCEMSTPKSPSPVRDLMPQHAPKIIPFEATNEPIRKSTNIIDPNELSVTWNNEKQDRYVNERPDIYASAAKSLGVTQAPKVSIFDRLGPVVPDVPEKPLLSNADLEMLSAGDDFVVICQNDSQPEKQQSPPKPEKSLADVNLKIPARIAPVPASKPKNVVNEVAPPVRDSKKHSTSSSSSSSSNTSKKVDKDEKKQPKQESKSNSVKTVPQNNKQEKVVKPDIFGSCLSSIDNMILEDSKVKKDKKKEERRHSSEHKKEKHHDSKHHHHHKHKDKDKRDEKTSKKDDSRQKADSKDKNNQNLPSEKQKDGSEKKEIKLPLPTVIPPIINNSITENPEKPKRLADKYNPKPRKHLEGDAAGSETINNFENRDPRRRGSILGNPPSILGNPPSILGNPTFPQPVPPPALALSPALPVIPGLTNFLAPSAQQPTIPPNLMQLNLQPPQDYQSPPVQQIQPPWLGDNHQDFARPIFEPPQKHFDPRNRQFHQDSAERVSGDPRRQPRFSPPPHISPIQAPQFAPNTFASNIYPNQALRNDFVPPAVQRSHFEPPSVVQTNNRFEPPRFEPPQSQINPSRKSFCPFEPLDSERETQNHFSGENFRRNEPFRKNFGGYNSNRFERISDRYARKPGRDNLKQLGNREEKIKPQSVKPQEEIHSKSDSDLTHTKYDEIYSKLDVERDTFSSPLESLYVSSKAAVKSSIQSFKIPKKPKPEPPAQLPPAPVVEESNVKAEIPEVKENPPSSKIEPTVVEESGSDEADDTPLFRRIRTRNKTQNKKNIIDDTDEEEKEQSEEKRNEIEEEEVEESQVESTNVTKRTKRQSAIIANKLIKNKTPLKPRRNPSQRRRDRRKKMKLRLQMKKETPAAANVKTEDIPEEKPQTQDLEDKSQIVETDVKKEEELEAPLKDELKIVDEIDDNKEGLLVKEESKDADPVRKAKEELLNEAKKKNLNLNDQGADVLQFILMNYKKIKKIFKSDSSSEDESKEKKKKKKKKQRERTTSSSSSSSDDDDGKKEKKKQTKEKGGSSDESGDKDKKKKQTKEKGGSSDEGDDKDKKKKLDAKSKKEEPVEVPIPALEVVEEKKEEEEVEDVEAPPKLAPKSAARKFRKIPARKNKFAQKKFQGRVTRNQALQASSPMRKTRRSELDKLHDDIKEMLMGSDLTSTGKRSCTMPKDDSEESKRGDSTEDTTTTTTSLDQNSPVIPVRNASLRVLIEKTDIEKLLTKETQKIAEIAENHEDSPKLEKIQQPPTVGNRFNRKRILRKKKHRWASGIIKRKYKRKISNSEDVKDTSSSIMGQRNSDELHDKDYFVDGAKSACKLCAFKGKLIVQHYRSAHPHSEVLISRMDPQTTEHLIHEAKMNDYASIFIENTPGVNKKLRYGFKCPFKCLIGTTVDTFENYYDHITGHTGEHRYFCPHCNFSTTNPRNLRAHMVHQHHANLEHHGKPRLPAPPASQYAFGFVCTVCNYVQTRRGRLESHIAKYHDNNAEIVKINLSLICKVHDDVPLNPSEMRSAKKQVHINECIESVVNGGGAVKTPEPALVKNLNIFELMSQIEAEEEEEEEPPVLVKMEPLDPEPELDALVPEIQLEEQQNLKPKDPDLTVFLCQSDLPIDDEQTIEKKRLKKMNEIQENCRSSRTSIVDKLQSRFENKALEVAQNEVSPARNSPISSPPPLIPLVTVDRSKKSLDSLPKSIVSTEVVMAPKKLAPISNIINRLQDKLLPSPTNGNNKQIFSSDSPSCLSPEKIVECNEAITDITIGPVSVAYQGRRDILYSCYIPFCVFTTADSTSYERHCKESHTDFVYNQSKCDYCQVKIDKEDDYVTMHDIYRHICTCHVDFFANARKTAEISPNVVTATDVGDVNNSVPEVVTNVISQAGDSPTGAKYPFKITNVTSLESDTNEDVESVVFPFVISNVSSGVESPPPAITSEKKMPEKSVEFSLPHEVPNLISQADNTSGPKFPFIITSVTSLAKKSTSTPPVTTVIVAPTLATPITLNATTIVSDSFLVSSIPTTSTMQTTPIVQPYTMASIQPSSIMGTSNTGSVVPIILNPLLATGKSKMQLPVISRVQSLASPKKDLIRPVPLNQLKSTPATLSVTGTVEKKGMINSVTLVNGEGNTIVLKDIALTMAERAELPKSKLTGKAMLTLDSVAKFYKCPQYFCTFASDRVNDLVNHLKIHGKLFNTYVRCLYCDYKTLYETYVLHLEVHHSNCEYACGRCFYRATNAAFVLAHNRVAHKDELIIIKTARENMPARINPQKLISIKSILKHYICGVKGCNFKTIFTDVFAEHLRKSHASNVRNVCHYCGGPQGGRLNHWAAHGVHPFHCRYCPVGSYSIEVVVNHQSLIHSKMDYCIISRKFVPNPNCPDRSPHSYTVEEDATYDRLYMMYGGVSAASNIPTFTIDNTTQESLLWNTTATSTSNTHLDTDSVFEVDLAASGNSQDDAPSVAEIPAITNTEETAITADEPEITIVEDNLDSGVKDPLSLDAADNTGNASDGFDSNDDKEQDAESGRYDPTATKHNEEYTGAMLYKCICYMGFEDKIKFKAHLVACQGDKDYKCAHCGVVRKSPRTLLTHMNIHGRKRFKCSLCQYKHFNKRFVRDHLNVDHNVHEMMVLPATVSKKIDYNKDDFVLRPKLSPLKRIGSMASVAEQLGSTKTVFSPREMDQLPRPPIYQTEVFCAVCNYATKVKSNMVRHLQAHQNDKAVPESAPVNPVPCLEKSEKMFDKMVNLALSSHSGGKMATPKTEKSEETRVPNFVPINKRWVCGAESCNYLCPEEGMLRRHLTTFHSQESNYTCLHCNSKLFDDKVINVDAILKHLKLHDNHLYGCSLCKFIHNLKHKVERHLSDKHPDKPASFVVFREIGKEVAETETASRQIEKEELKKEWRCGMCKYRTTTIEDVKIHTQSKHNVNSKNKCALCEFGSEDVGSFGKHFELNHSGQSVDMVVAYYKEDEIKQQKQDTDAEFNTTPLWQRNKNIKHIRGILLEETNNKVGKTVGTKKAKTLKSKKLELAREELNINKKDHLTPKQSMIVSEMILPLNKPSESPKQLTLDADPILPVEVKKSVPMSSDLISPSLEPKLPDKLTSDPILLTNKSSDMVNKPGPKSLIIISKANKGPETKKPGLRRRRCKLIVKRSSGTNKTTVPKKPVQKDTDDTDDDVILLEDNSQPEIINVDEIQEKEKNEEKTTKSKQGIIVLSDHKLDTSTVEKKDMVIDLDLDVPDAIPAPKGSEELSLMCTERMEGIDRSCKKSDIFATLTPIPIKVPAKGPTSSKSDIIEIASEKMPDKEEKISKKDQESPPAEASKSFISFTTNDVIELSTSDDTSESQKEDTSTEKIDKSITEVLESCKLTFDDSSEDEDVDILEMSKEGPIKSLFPCVGDKEEVSVDKNLVLIVEDSPSILEDEVVMPEDKSSLLKDKPSTVRDKSCMVLRDEAWMPESKTSLLKDKPSMVRDKSSMMLEDEPSFLKDKSSMLLRDKSSMMLEDKPLFLTDKSSVMRDKSSTLEDIAWIPEDDPSLLKDKPLTTRDKSPTVEDKPSVLRDKSSAPEDKPSLLKDTPSIVRDKSSKLEDKPSMLKNKPSMVRDESSTMKDDTAILEDKPSKLKNKSLIRDEFSMLKDKPSLLEDKPSKLKNKSLKLIDEFSTLKDKISMLEDKPSKWKKKSLTLIDEFSTLKKKISMLEDRPSKLKNKPTMMKDKSSKVKDKASMLEDKPSKLKSKLTMMKDESSTMKDKASMPEDKPSKLKNKSLTLIDEFSTLKDKTSMLEDKPSKLKNEPSMMRDKFSKLEDKPSTLKDKPSLREKTPSMSRTTALERENALSILENTSPLLENSNSSLKSTPSMLENTSSSLKNTASVLESAPSSLENAPSMLENASSLLENTPLLEHSPSSLENTHSMLENSSSLLESASLLENTPSLLKNTASVLENTSLLLENTSLLKNVNSSLENAPSSSLRNTPSSLENTPSSLESTLSSLESASSSLQNTPSLLENPPSVAKSPVSATQTLSANIAKSPSTVRTDKETTSPDKREAKNDKPTNENLFDEDDIPLKKIKLDMSIKEIEKMSKNDLLEGNFVGTYGPYGVPWNGNYMCPLCEKFVTVSNKEFTMHVYQELQYGSYKCTACDFRDSTESTVVKHHTDTHKDVDTAERAILSPDQQIIDWVEKLIVFQTRILTLEKEELSDVLFYCYFCDHKCVNPSDMRKHQVRHWTVQPYACNVCNFKAVYRVVLENHIKRCHPRVNATIKETDLGGEVIIKRIRLSARSDKSEESTDQYETWEIDCDVGFDAEHLKDVLLGCGYCTHWQKLPELRKHIKERHPNENFKAYRYRCNFCASTFVSTFTLDQHFISCHSGMRRCFSEVSETLRTYSCPECHVSDDKLINIKEHLRTHFKMIKCMYCNLKVVYWKSMRKHYREHHRNENFEFVFLISQERLYEQAVNNITTNAVRNGNSASSSITGNSNKKRKHSDEDLDDSRSDERPSKAVKIKQVARKSTGGYHRKSEARSSSHSTKQQNPVDLNNVMTTIDVMGASVTMNIVQLSKILNINPVVVIEDCETDP